MGLFNKRLAYGKEAEKFIAKFFIKRGWKVEVDEEYGFMPDNEYKGARLLVLPSRPTLLEAETESHEIIAPDMRVRKNGVCKYIEVKRRAEISRFNDFDILYIDAKCWYDYSELDYLCRYDNYGDGVVLFLCIDNYKGREAVFYQNIGFLKENVQHHVKNEYIAFRLSNFVRQKI